METLLSMLEGAVTAMAKVGISLVELAGISILLITAAQALYHYFKHTPHIRLQLAEGIALALEFKLGGEVLRTVLVRDFQELLVLGSVILLRAALTLLIHWEIKNEQNSATSALHAPLKQRFLRKAGATNK